MQNQKQTDDSREFTLSADPLVRKLHHQIANLEDAAINYGTSKNFLKFDYRLQLSNCLAATEDFLKHTSRDPNYSKSANVTPYKLGGWL